MESKLQAGQAEKQGESQKATAMFQMRNYGTGANLLAEEVVQMVRFQI